MYSNHFHSDHFGRCYVCNRLTNRIDFCFEQYVCSPECDRKMNEMYQKYLEHVSDINEDGFF